MFRFENRCNRIRRLLSDRMDAPLAARDEQRVQAHLIRCPACRREMAFYEEIKKTARALEAVNPPDYLWDRISVELEVDPWGGGEYSRGQSRWGLLPGFALAGKINFVGAVLSFMLIAVLCLLPGGDGEKGLANGTAVQAREMDAHLEYLSLYMIANGDRYPSEVREYYLGQMEGLDQKIRMIKSALNRFPENHRIQAQLARAYQSKIDLYRRIGIANLEQQALPASGHRPFNHGGQYE